jgi:hypothetical protein
MIKDISSYSLKSLLILILSLVALTIPNLKSAQAATKVYFFYGKGCPHCSEVEIFFEENNIVERYPVEIKEVYFDRSNAILFTKLMDNLGVPEQTRGVPTVVIGNKVLVGDKPIIQNFEKEVDDFLQNTTEETQSNTTPKQENINGTPRLDLTLPAVVAASVVDAINPCAFAVLIILMSTILIGGNSKKALKTGFVFASSIFISYFLMGLGLYKALELGGLSNIFFKIIGWLAIILGVLNLKDW